MPIYLSWIITALLFGKWWSQQSQPTAKVGAFYIACKRLVTPVVSSSPVLADALECRTVTAIRRTVIAKALILARETQPTRRAPRYEGDSGEILLVVYAHTRVIRRFLGAVIAGSGEKNDAHRRYSNGPYAGHP